MSLFELIYKWRHYDISKALSDIETVRNFPTKEFAVWQEKQRWEVASYLYNHNTFYRKFVGDVFPAKWEELPVVRKAELQSDPEKLLSSGFEPREIYINNTSGSSGHPLKFTKDYYTQARVWAAKKLFFNMHDIDIGDKEARFYGIPKNLKGHLTQRLKDLVLNRYRFVIFEMSDVIFKKWVEKFSRTKFDYIYGYTSSIVLFSRYLNEHNIVIKKICPSLKVCMVTSETCTPEDKKIIEQAFGVKVVQEYGTTDAGLLGYECSSGNMHIPEENVFVEVNESGELLVTDMFNKTFPFVRYKVGDMAEVEESKCSCGSHNRIISKLMGRTNDVIKLPSGSISPGFTFYYVSRSLLESSGVLKEFIIRQTALDTFVFDVVSDSPLQSADIEELKRTAEEYLEPGLNIIVNQVKQIERPVSGKIKHFYSVLKKS